MKKWGHAVAIAENGKIAVNKLKEQNFDLILMDIQMPEMDGLEATTKIRNSNSIEINANIPIIALTAHALKSDQERCKQVGMNDFLTKPIDVDALSAVLKKYAVVKINQVVN